MLFIVCVVVPFILWVIVVRMMDHQPLNSRNCVLRFRRHQVEYNNDPSVRGDYICPKCGRTWYDAGIS